MQVVRAVAILAVLLSVAVTPLFSQQPSPPQPPERVVINFLSAIDTNSVNMLLSIVNAQVRQGVKKITIVISSPGGDTTAAFAAYNILRNSTAEITTFNAGNIDSAAMLIYCAGKHRYSFPEPARFLIHSNAMTLGVNVPLDYNFLNAQLQQLVSLNQMVTMVLEATAKDKNKEIEQAVRSQTILTPVQAKEWGIVQDIRTDFMEPGAILISVDTPSKEQKNPVEYTTLRPSISAGEPAHQ